ncbi:DNA-binding transcriptional regulator, LysR family [Variovorax sp. HW608]|uniref:LysR family transcriptional regulator n=1 Tax=Variovorax sp. HW608 TaxID=1034889 RepID=UPI0008201477|nr:LysR family transcriptional regulator [Variovorax sp. HW608]SCK36183.1 DNA-binding transcriptional regulator, LysR family [Variovorax sp. HW608]
MDSLDLLKAFREVAARGSFSRAATTLGMSKANISKYVAQLEERLGVRLLNRSTRSVSLTDAGHLLLERSTPFMEMVELTQSELQEHAGNPRGRLRITAPHGLSQGKFPGLIGEFMATYPDVHVSLHLSNRVIDLVGEGVDIALRLGRIRDENLIVRRLQRMDLALCATPGYWAKRGLPRKPDDMRRHDVLTYSLAGNTPSLPFEVDGKPYSVPVHSRMDANDAAPLIGVALSGLGAVCVPAIMAQPEIERGALVPVLKDYMPTDLWLYAAYTQRRHNSAALRAMLDFLESRVAEAAPARPAKRSTRVARAASTAPA